MKIEVEKEPSLRKQTPPSSTSPGCGPICVWIRLLPFNFRSLEYSQTTLQCNFRAMFALGPMVKLINFQGCGNQRTKRQKRVENQTGRLKEKKKRLPFSSFQWAPGGTPTEPTINIESLWCVTFLNLSRTLLLLLLLLLLLSFLPVTKKKTLRRVAIKLKEKHSWLFTTGHGNSREKAVDQKSNFYFPHFLADIYSFPFFCSFLITIHWRSHQNLN